MLQVTKVAALTGHTGSIYTLLQGSAQNFFYSGSGDGMVIRWDLNDMSNGTVVAKIQANIFSLCNIASTDMLLIGQMQGGIHVVDLAEKKEIRHLSFHRNGVYDIQLQQTTNKILSAGGDGVLSVIDGKDFSLISSLRISEKSIRQLAFHPSQQIIAAGCSDNTAYLLDASNFSILHRLEPHESSVFSVCFSPDGNYLLTGSRDAQLRVWDAGNDYRLLQTIPAHLFTINCIIYSPDGKLIATAGRDKTIKIWDAENFNLLKVIDKDKHNGHINSVNKLLWTGEYLISCSDDRSILVWRLAV